MTQQGDILLYQTDDGGDVNVAGGLIEMSGGLDTTVYLSLFGGNETSATWWGNETGGDTDDEYHSETGLLLDSLPATSGNLIRIEDAVRRDLKWMIELGAVKTVDVIATVPNINRVKIKIIISADETIEFVENWSASL